MADQDKLGMAKEWETPAAAVEEPKPEAAKQKFVREYDVGDGSGKQRFEADTQEALIDKIAQAHENASRTIHKLQRDYKELSRGRQPEKQSSDFQELKPSTLKPDDLMSLQSNPHALFRRMFEAEAGMSLEEFRVRENDRRRQEAEMKAQQQFVQLHAEDYTPTPENAQKIMRFLQKENLPVSKANLDYAFQELRGELGSLKPAERVTPPVEAKPSSPAPALERQVSPPPSFVRPSLGGRSMEDTVGGTDVTSAEFARIAQLPPAEMKARIEQIFRQSRSGR